MRRPSSCVIFCPFAGIRVRVVDVCLFVAALWFAGGVHADGELRWTFATGPSSWGPVMESSPAVDSDGTVFFSVAFTALGTGQVIALTPNGDTADYKWVRDMPDETYASPVLGPGGALYIGCMDGIFYAFDKQTKELKWSYDTNQKSTLPTYIFSSAALSQDGQTIYVGVGTFGKASVNDPSPGAIFALTIDGKFKWVRWFPDVVESSPAVGANGTIYVGCWDSNVYAINPDGSEKWHRTLDAEITASPAIGGDGSIYIGSLGKRFVALSPDNVVKWEVPIITMGSPVVGPDGTVYVGSYGDASLLALDRVKGNVKWQAVGQPTYGSAPTLRADGVILFGGEDRVLRAYDPKAGDILWECPLNGHIMTAPAISPTADHNIFVAAGNGRLYGIRGNAFGLSQYSSWPTFHRDLLRTGRSGERATDGQLLNLSARGPAGGGRNLIAGLTMNGTGTKKVLIRAVGPTLRVFGIGNPLDDPKLAGHVDIAPSYVPYENDNWGANPDAAAVIDMEPRVGAFGLEAGSKDAAVLPDLDASLKYTTSVESAGPGAGVAMVEVYDAEVDKPSSRLINLSTRGFVGNGEGVLIAGIAIGGTGKLRVLARAIGPGLQQFGVSGVLARPSISVYNRDGNLLGSNTGWMSTGVKGDMNALFDLVGAFRLNESSADSALILTLAPGIYTFHVSGVDATTGEAMVEAYALPF